ncbi:MAG: hypothetical protein HY671_04250 [Chloroflexi bacterium]|nr:hypothetical protein [Chloroflexota bacterium]
MNKKLDRELESSENWDYDHPVVREPVKASRVVVSVAFQRLDFNRVAQAAERSGKKVSEFIREAALEKASGSRAASIEYSSGSTGAVWLVERMPSTTQVAASLIKEFERGTATTH